PVESDLFNISHLQPVMQVLFLKFFFETLQKLALAPVCDAPAHGRKTNIPWLKSKINPFA
ncbi:hypothetical protein, partial [Paenibacillus elgii]|uniref:hypothetical protein n=1 Tax=Paenibacillus elgii TaxID=189691 RepID=UPI001C3FE5A1